MAMIPKLLEKVRITAYPDSKRRTGGEEFECLLDSTDVNLYYENKFNPRRGINTSGRESDYSYSEPNELCLKLLIDSTIVSDHALLRLPYDERQVKKRVDHFLRLCYYMDGGIHEPRYLVVSWGEIQFECRLKKVDVSYKLFDNNAEPLRAELQTLFVADMDDKKAARKDNKKSPDITHEVLFKSGDTLPLLAKQVYGDAGQYLMVAAHNQLDDFRNIQPGTLLQFPPLITEA